MTRAVEVRDRRAIPHPVSDWIIERTPRPLRPGVELVLRTVDDALDDRIVGLAAEIAFFALLSLPPLLLTVAASLGFLSEDLTTRFVTGLTRASRSTFTGPTIDNVIEPTLQLLTTQRRVDVISVSFAVTVFSASRVMRVLLDAVGIAYDMDRERQSWRQRLYGLGATLGLLLLAPVLVPLLVVGPDLGEQLARLAAVPDQFGTLWRALYFPSVGVLAILVVATTYHLAAPWWTPWRRDLPGALLTVVIWLAGSAGLQLYTSRAISDPDVYGPLAGPLVLLVWLYLLAFAVLLGAEFNAELERLFPSPEQQRAPARDRLRQRASAARRRVRAVTNGNGRDTRGHSEDRDGP